MKIEVGFLGILTILFIVLKLTGTIGWSWWIVLMPILFVPGLVFCLFSLLVVLAVIMNLLGIKGWK